MSNYPLTAYHFRVEWGGRRIDFTEVSGLDRFIDPIPVHSGASPQPNPALMPGQEKYNTLTLKRTIQKDDNDFYLWMNTKEGNHIERRDIVISLLNEHHEPIFVWRLQKAFPIRYSGPVFSASANEIAYEEIELVHEGMSVSAV